MSMISEQVDRLRKVAQVERDLGCHEFEQVLLDAADTIWELSGRLTHWELHECPGCKNVADLQEALDENAKLRELCADMGMCLTWQWEPHGYMMDGCDHCRFKKKTGGMCGLGMFRGRMRELGIEVG